jgi:hypothetical protein
MGWGDTYVEKFLAKNNEIEPKPKGNIIVSFLRDLDID